MKPSKSGRDQPGRCGSWCATTLLLGMAILPAQADRVSVLPGLQTRSFLSLESGVGRPVNTQVDPRAIAPFDPSMGSLPGLPSSEVTPMGVPSDDGADAQAIDGGSGPELLSVNAAAAMPTAPNGPCAQLTETPVTGDGYWNSQAGGAMPSLLAASSTIAAAVPASGMPTQLSAHSLAGSWCRPGPIEDSSPLATRSFWSAVLILLFGLVAFWITRGFALPR